METSVVTILSYLPTLVVDANSQKAQVLADQLTHNGFPADATDCAAAGAAIRARHYGSVVFVTDLSAPDELECLITLRSRVLRTWIIVISWGAPPEKQEWALRQGADALLKAPFSLQDLLSRLLAFALRSRPL